MQWHIHSSLELLDLIDPLVLASQVARTIGTRYHARIIKNNFFCVETRSCYVVQSVLELLDLSDHPMSASQSVKISDIIHPVQLEYLYNIVVLQEMQEGKDGLPSQ